MSATWTPEGCRRCCSHRELAAPPAGPSDTSEDGHFPLDLQREYEEQLLRLCASRTLEPAHWMACGPRFFMAGLAVTLASVNDLDRKSLLALAERLHPGASEPAVFAQWLKRSPLRPSRFLPMLQMGYPACVLRIVADIEKVKSH